MNEQTVKCPICGEPYVFYAFKAGDQSACPKCQSKARGGSLRDRIARARGGK
jgi:DNA-directed RNA polymerase subunit RPC12/RpoP